MSGINFPINTPPVGLNANIAMANFEEEKTFFCAMYVVITPNTRRRLKRKRSRAERERETSCLGRVIRRFRESGLSLRKEKKGHCNNN